jgi:hypothetical protein
MKSLLVLTTGLLLTISGVAATVPDSEKPSVAYVTNQNVVKVFYKAPTFDNVSVTIYDSENRKVFSETIRKISGFARPYNLSSLPVGSYTLKVSIGSVEISKVEQVVVDLPKEKLKLAEETVAHLTSLKNSRGKYVLSVPYRRYDKLDVLIYNEAKQLIHRSNLKVAGETAIVLNLKGITGKYFLDVVTKNKIRNSFPLTNQ